MEGEATAAATSSGRRTQRIKATITAARVEMDYDGVVVRGLLCFGAQGLPVAKDLNWTKEIDFGFLGPAGRPRCFFCRCCHGRSIIHSCGVAARGTDHY